MFLYKKKSPIKQHLAKQRMFQHKNTRTCPRCKQAMQLADSTAYGDSYFCQACSSTHTYTSLPENVKQAERETQLGAITLRDRSKTQKSKRDTTATPEQTEQYLADIRRAMQEVKVLLLEYTNRNRQESSRIVEPYKLVRDGSGALILYARILSEEENGIRVFKLDKITKLEVQQYTFKPIWPIEDKVDNK